MPPDRPPKITLPAREPGARRIMAGQLQVGHALADHRWRWTGYCWLVAGHPGEGFAAEVIGADLRNLRDQLTVKVAEEGPWWTE